MVKANLVANEQAVRPPLIFLVIRGAKVREEANRAAEWDQRADEEMGGRGGGWISYLIAANPDNSLSYPKGLHIDVKLEEEEK